MKVKWTPMNNSAGFDQQDATRLWPARPLHYPDWSQHGHYRIYGHDIVQRLSDALPHTWVVLVKGTDPVTGRQDMGFILSYQRRWHDLPIQLGLRAKSVNRPA